jgi:excisionase family DNA binding protein
MTTKSTRAERFLTVPQVAERLGVSARSIWRWLDERELIAHRFGRLVRISEADLQAFLDSKKQG